MRLRFKLIFIIFSGLFLFDIIPVISKCVDKNCYSDEKISLTSKKKSFLKSNAGVINLKSKRKIENNNSNISEILINEEIRLDKLIANFFITNSELIASNVEKFKLEIDSDSQSKVNDVFYAEGNVLVYLSNGKIKADKIEYDIKNKIFKAEGNITFESGDQFISAEYFEYNNKIKYGYLKNPYGILDIRNLKNDLKINSYLSNNNLKSRIESKDFKDLPTEVQLLSSSNVRLSNKFIPNSFQLNFSEITKWRFKSERIEITSNAWSSNLIYFTNDPFNKPQFLIKSKNFTGEIIDEKTVLRSEFTSIIFDDKITIPIGKKTIQDNDAIFRWGLGYEKDKKDGFYILRNFDPIDIGENFSINLQSNFLLNRLFLGETSAFRAKDSPVMSDNIKTNANFSDLFGLKSDIYVGFDEWKMNINSSLNSFDYKKLYDSFSADLLLKRNLRNIEKDNYSLDLSFYSNLNGESVYSSYGTKLIFSDSSNRGKLSKNRNIIFDIGNFNAKKNGDDSVLVSSSRYGLNSSIGYSYKLVDFNKRDELYGTQNKYKPKEVDQGLYLNSTFAYGLYEYGIGDSQSIVSFKLGPSLTYGDFKKDFLDFTSVSIMPELVIKNSKSPFDFDDFNENERIKVDIQQQLFGPLLMGLSTYFIIDSSNDNYGKFVDQIYYLGISRRAYDLGLYYNENKESISLDFKIFNFGYSNFSKKF